MKTLHLGNAHTSSKAVKRQKEIKRLTDKFGKESAQLEWFKRGRIM